MPNFPYLFSKHDRVADIEKTPTSDQAGARDKPIRFAHGQVNRVRRFGAFSRSQTKKLPWDRALAAELTLCLPANARSRKEVRSLACDAAYPGVSIVTDGCCGGDTRPSQRLADCRCGYTSFSATAHFRFWQFRRFLEGVKLGTTPRSSLRDGQSVGATPDPRKGCSVNTTESASRLTRLHKAPAARPGSGVALTGGDAVSFQEDNQAMTNQTDPSVRGDDTRPIAEPDMFSHWPLGEFMDAGGLAAAVRRTWGDKVDWGRVTIVTPEHPNPPYPDGWYFEGWSVAPHRMDPLHREGPFNYPVIHRGEHGE